MAFTTAGLTNGGTTTHYKFQYDDSLQQTAANPTGPEPARMNAAIAACENDFNLMSGWFGNIALDVNTPIPVNVTQNSGGASWRLSGGNLIVTINPGNGAASFVRYLLISEMVEQFMRAQTKGWFGQGTEGSQGEGLSRFLAAQFLLANGLGNVPAGFDNSNAWLSTSRADFVNHIEPTDDGPDARTGCALLFIYYLAAQLAFSINDIVGAGASTLAGVYKNLTGISVDPFPSFKQRLDSAFPGTATITGPNLDNPYPLWAKQFGIAFPGSTRLDSPLVPLLRTPGHEELFWIGANGDISSNWRNDTVDNGQWHQQFAIAIPGSVREDSPLVAIARTPQREDVFWIGANSDVSHAWRDDSIDGGQWHTQVGIAIPGSVRAGSPLIVFARTRETIEVFWLGTNGDVSSTFLG
jgi:hypothetical protein